MDFGEKLKALRTERGLTQEQLAARLYVSRTAVSKWETGGGSPNLDSLQAVARLFDVSVDDLLVYCFRHFSRSGRALYLPFQIWDKGRVEGGGRRTTSWDLAL
ncbi:helix-turn-helix domain-containing protein, partial [Eggerthella lenta]